MRPALALAVVAAFTSMATVFVVKTFADTIFLAAYGVDYVPHFFVAQSAVVIGISFGYSWAIRRGALAIDAAIFVALAAASAAAPALAELATFALALALVTLSTLAQLAIWNAATSVVTGRKARAFLPRVGAAATAGAVAGGFASSGLVGIAGIEALAWVSAGLAAVTLALRLALQRSGPETRPRSRRPPPSGKRESARRLVVLLACLVIGESLLSAFVDFGFKREVADAYASDADAIGMFFALYYGITNVALLATQLVAASRVLATRSLRATLALEPLALAAVCAAWAVFPVLALGALARGIEGVAKFAIARPAQEVAMAPLSDATRRRLKVILRGVLAPGGGAVAGGLLIAAAPLLDEHALVVPAACLALAIGLAVIARATAGHYLAAIGSELGLRQMTRAGADTDADPVLSRDALAKLLELAGDADRGRAELGRDLLAELVPTTAVLAPHVGAGSTATRRAVYELLVERPSRACEDALREAVAREPDTAGALDAGLLALAALADRSQTERARDLARLDALDPTAAADPARRDAGQTDLARDLARLDAIDPTTAAADPARRDAGQTDLARDLARLDAIDPTAAADPARRDAGQTDLARDLARLDAIDPTAAADPARHDADLVAVAEHARDLARRDAIDPTAAAADPARRDAGQTDLARDLARLDAIDPTAAADPARHDAGLLALADRSQTERARDLARRDAIDPTAAADPARHDADLVAVAEHARDLARRDAIDPTAAAADPARRDAAVTERARDLARLDAIDPTTAAAAADPARRDAGQTDLARDLARLDAIDPTAAADPARRAAWIYLSRAGALDGDPRHHAVLAALIAVDGASAAAACDAAIARGAIDAAAIDAVIAELAAPSPTEPRPETGQHPPLTALPRERWPDGARTTARHQALVAAAALGREAGIAIVIGELAAGSLWPEQIARRLAGDALGRVCARVLDDAHPARRRQRVLAALRASDQPEVTALALQVLARPIDASHESLALRDEAVRILRTRTSDADIPPAAIERALGEHLDRFAIYLRARPGYATTMHESQIEIRFRGGLTDPSAEAFLLDELERCTERELRRLCALLAILGNPEAVLDAERGLRAPTFVRRRQAVDVLQEVVQGRHKARLLELLELYLMPPRVNRHDGRAAALELDPWLARCSRADTDPGARRLWALRSAPLFDAVDGVSLARLAERAEELELAAGTVVVREGDPGDALYVVIDGALAVERDRQLVVEIGPGETFGELALLDGAPRHASVRARARARVLVLPRAAFDHALATQPEIGVGLLLGLVRWLRRGKPAPRLSMHTMV